MEMSVGLKGASFFVSFCLILLFFFLPIIVFLYKVFRIRQSVTTKKRCRRLYLCYIYVSDCQVCDDKFLEAVKGCVKTFLYLTVTKTKCNEDLCVNKFVLHLSSMNDFMNYIDDK